jgi:hypothetical protein
MTKLCVAVSALILTSTASVAQQAIAPPPRHADSGPSLEVTMKFIHNKLIDQGRLDYITRDDDGTGNGSYQVLKVEVNSDSCMMNYKDEKDDLFAHSYRFSFRDIERLEVTNLNQTLANGGFHLVYTPTLFQLTIYAEKPAIDHVVQCQGEACGGFSSKHEQIKNAVLAFDSEDAANRVAKAMLHAVELCGGGNHDPF